MYIQNRRYSSKFKDYIPLQYCIGLISLEPAIAYFCLVCCFNFYHKEHKVFSQRTQSIVFTTKADG